MKQQAAKMMTRGRRRISMIASAGAAAVAALAWPAPAAGPIPFVPVLAVDFPDPFVLRSGSEYLAYATNTDRGRINVPMAVSRDLATWTQLRDPADAKRLRDAMPTLAPWAKRGWTWAPEVLAVGGKYVLYFTARHAKSDLQCVGAAVAVDPRGPFVSTDAEPLVCQFDLGGTIDASPFRDADGALYLYYKNDGNNPRANKPAEIFGQRMSADGLRLTGAPVSLARNDKPWEGRVVEAPTMTTLGGGYQLFYSANDYGWQPTQRLSLYAIGYADCRGPLGPCVDAPRPLLTSRMGAAGCISGPGHQSIFNAGSRSFITYHGWETTSGCRKAADRRLMYVSPLIWSGGKPEVRMTLRRADR